MKQAVCVILRNPEGKILGVSRKYNKEIFDFPGGKVEDYDESLRAAIIRETLEETGLKIFNLKLIFGEEDNDFEQFVYTADYEGEINFDETIETHVVAWVEPEVIMQGAFGAFNKKVLKTIGIEPERPLGKMLKYLQTEAGEKDFNKKISDYVLRQVERDNQILLEKEKFDLMTDEEFKNLIIEEEKIQNNDYGADDSETMKNVLRVMVDHGKEFLPRKWENFAASYTRYKGLTAILYQGQGSFIRIKSGKKVLYQQN